MSAAKVKIKNEKTKKNEKRHTATLFQLCKKREQTTPLRRSGRCSLFLRFISPYGTAHRQQSCASERSDSAARLQRQRTTAQFTTNFLPLRI